MNAVDRIGKAGLVPVVVIDNAEDAVPTAKALLDGGLDVMEITMRTEAGVEAIKRVSEAYPEMLVGAGTVLSVEKAKQSVSAGAQFIVSPGFNPEVVEWCIENKIEITPGCVTPTEIEKALSFGLKILKFFPADVYGGVKGCKAMHGPFGPFGVKFIPTGGVNYDNLKDYAGQSFIHAIGGGWLCNKADINNHNFDAITASVKKSIEILLGFEFAHMGINAVDDSESLEVVSDFSEAFELPIKKGSSSNFAGPSIEVTKVTGLGRNGHIAIRTNSIHRAIHYIEKRGFQVDMSTAKYKGDVMVAVYLKNETGGFAIHLLQK